MTDDTNEIKFEFTTREGQRYELVVVQRVRRLKGYSAFDLLKGAHVDGSGYARGRGALNANEVRVLQGLPEVEALDPPAVPLPRRHSWVVRRIMDHREIVAFLAVGSALVLLFQWAMGWL